MLKTGHYCLTKENLGCHELIGLNAKVVKSSDQNKAGLKGKIVDETKNTFRLETSQGEKVLPKKEVWLELSLGQEKVLLAGEKLCFKPEARTKALGRKSHGN